MRIGAALLIASCLAACGDSDPAEQPPAGEPMSAEEAATELGEVVQLRPGEYATSVELLDVSIPGMPGVQAEGMAQMMSGAASGTTFCLTPEEAEQGPERMVQEMASADCRFDRLETSGGTIAADMQCTSGEGTAGHYVLDGEMTPESSTMTMRIEQALPGIPGAGDMRMEMRVSSRRVGDCGQAGVTPLPAER